jgi:hypothetical protein
MGMDRPSHKEINRRIKEAKEAVSENRVSILSPADVAADALELGLDFGTVTNILIEILEEITPGHYVGLYPPQRSYKDEIMDCELFAFRWLSKRLGCRTYLKFTIKDNRMWLVSFHEDRKGKKRK